MNGFKLQRLGILMEPEPGNPRRSKAYLIQLPLVAGMVNSISSRGWSRREITLASALRECGSTKWATRRASSGSASH
jgi:hypothetical protein